MIGHPDGLLQAEPHRDDWVVLTADFHPEDRGGACHHQIVGRKDGGDARPGLDQRRAG